MYTYSSTIRLHHTDATGFIYFPNYFALATECFESFLDTSLPLASLLKDGKLNLPVVHAVVDCKIPLSVCDPITIEMILCKSGTTSFTLGFDFKLDNGKVAACVEIVHVAVDKKTGLPVAIPEALHALLKTIPH